MPRPPNYSQDRQNRDRAKANKKAEKLAAKAAAKEQPAERVEADEQPSDQSVD